MARMSRSTDELLPGEFGRTPAMHLHDSAWQGMQPCAGRSRGAGLCGILPEGYQYRTRRRFGHSLYHTIASPAEAGTQCFIDGIVLIEKAFKNIVLVDHCQAKRTRQSMCKRC